MSWTKGELVDEAFSCLALNGFIYNLDPEMRQMGVRRLDAMMAGWDVKGIRLGYPISSSADGSNVDQDSNLPDYSIEAVFTNLCKRLAEAFGKTLTAETLARAKDGYDMLLGRAAMPPEVQYPGTLPRGAGNKPWRYQNGPFFPVPTDPLTTGPDSELNFE